MHCQLLLHHTVTGGVITRWHYQYYVLTYAYPGTTGIVMRFVGTFDDSDYRFVWPYFMGEAVFR